MFREFIAQETHQVTMVGEHMRFRTRRIPAVGICPAFGDRSEANRARGESLAAAESSAHALIWLNASR